MANKKIRFLRDYEIFDEKQFDWLKDEVVSFEEIRAAHYVDHLQVAEYVPANTAIFRPKRQVEIPVDTAPEVAQESVSILERFSNWLASIGSEANKNSSDLDPEVFPLLERISDWITTLGPETKLEDAERSLAEILPNALEAAKVITDKAEEDGKAILFKAGEDGDRLIGNVKTEAEGIISRAKVEAKKIKDKK